MRFSVFTKPWKDLPAAELFKKVAAWGFDGIEFPLRAGFQVEPQNAETELPAFADEAAEHGLQIMSVASATDAHIFAACHAAGVPLIRIMAGIDLEKGYLQSERDFKTYLNRLLPLCERYGVKVGVQNHFGPMVFSTMELRHLLEDFDPKYVGAVWDAAHSGLAGEIAAQALDIIWEKLLLVNLKNAYWKPTNGPEAPKTQWAPHFTLGRFGMASYPDIINYLARNHYNGDICMPAEFSDDQLAEALVPVELAYVKDLFSLAGK